MLQRIIRYCDNENAPMVIVLIATMVSIYMILYYFADKNE